MALTGVKLFVNMKSPSDPDSEDRTKHDAKKALKKLGASVVLSVSEAQVVVFYNGSESVRTQAASKNIPTVHPQWLIDCGKIGRKLPVGDYPAVAGRKSCDDSEEGKPVPAEDAATTPLMGDAKPQASSKAKKEKSSKKRSGKKGDAEAVDKVISGDPQTPSNRKDVTTAAVASPYMVDTQQPGGDRPLAAPVTPFVKTVALIDSESEDERLADLVSKPTAASLPPHPQSLPRAKDSADERSASETRPAARKAKKPSTKKAPKRESDTSENTTKKSKTEAIPAVVDAAPAEPAGGHKTPENTQEQCPLPASATKPSTRETDGASSVKIGGVVAPRRSTSSSAAAAVGGGKSPSAAKRSRETEAERLQDDILEATGIDPRVRPPRTFLDDIVADPSSVRICFDTTDGTGSEDEDESEELATIALCLEGTVCPEVFGRCEKPTHLILTGRGSLTAKALFCVAADIPVVTKEWLYASLSATKFVPAKPFLHPATTANMELDPRDALTSVVGAKGTVYVTAGAFPKLRRSDVVEVLEACGIEVVRNPSAPSLALTIASPELYKSVPKHVPCVNIEWLWKCVVQRTGFAFGEFPIGMFAAKKARQGPAAGIKLAANQYTTQQLNATLASTVPSDSESDASGLESESDASSSTSQDEESESASSVSSAPKKKKAKKGTTTTKGKGTSR